MWFKTCSKRERAVTWRNPAAQTLKVFYSSSIVPLTNLPRKTCQHSASSVVAIRISCCVIEVFVFRKLLFTYDANQDSCIIKCQRETWLGCIVFWLEQTLLITHFSVKVATQSRIREYMKQSLKCPISEEIYSWLLDVTAFVYVDKIRMNHPCGGRNVDPCNTIPLGTYRHVIGVDEVVLITS